MTPESQLIQSAFSDCLDSTNLPEVSVMAGELSSRRYFRITGGISSGISVNNSPEKKPTYVLQESESFENAAEHPFLIAQKIFSALGIRVPRIHGASGKEGWILVEDCGDYFLQYRQELPLYREAIDMILTLQRHGQKDDARIPAELKTAPHWSWLFDHQKFQAEMNYTEEYFFRGLLKEDFPFAKCMTTTIDYLAARPSVLCHRDFHSRNLLVKDEHVYALDFQDARMGPVSYDLVSLLWDPYARIKNDLRTKLLAEWTAATHPDYLDGIEVEIERMKIQRLLKAIGNYSSFYTVKKNPACFVFIEPALKDTLDAFDGLATKNILNKDEQKLQSKLHKIYKKVEGQ